MSIVQFSIQIKFWHTLLIHCKATDQFGPCGSSFLLLPISQSSLLFPLGPLDKLKHALDNLIRHSRRRHIWQILAVARSPRCSRVPEHVRLLHELVRQPWRVRGLGVRHSSRGRRYKVMSRLRRIFGDASSRVGGRFGALQRL
jgi:hypothetical protein